MGASEAELARLRWRVCPSCNKPRDMTDLFLKEHTTCLICQRKAERVAEGMLHKSSITAERNYRRQLRNTRAAMQRMAERLQESGFPQEEIDKSIKSRFRKQLKRLKLTYEEITHAES